MKRKEFRTASSCWLALIVCLMFAGSVLAAGQTLTTIHRFKGGTADGSQPEGNLIADAAGNFYGTTFYGGSGACKVNKQRGCGTVFELSPPTTKGAPWTVSVLYSFTGGADGSAPFVGLVFDQTGNLYGESQGGSSGYGTVFQLAPPAKQGDAWTETVLHSFGKEGDVLSGSLVFDKAGNLYGTTAAGGQVGAGALFQLVPPAIQGDPWTETVLHNFWVRRNDGIWPSGTLIFDKNGDLYGTTELGGGGERM
jgi:uncharacterized repeat protein (TIGR03803 family)